MHIARPLASMVSNAVYTFLTKSLEVMIEHYQQFYLGIIKYIVLTCSLSSTQRQRKYIIANTAS